MTPRLFSQMLALPDYRAALRLDEPWPTEAEAAPLAPAAVPALVDELRRYLLTTYPGLPTDCGPADAPARRAHLQALLTVLPPAPPLPAAFHAGLDRLLRHEQQARPVTEALTLPRLPQTLPGTRYPAAAQCALWQGDITQLRVDAIVNAANSQLLGCFQPFHRCIDNAIHTAAGPRLREDCYHLMQTQGELEATGTAKLTRAYNLPARYVLHTVGPIVARGTAGPSPAQCAQLASCYTTCLDLTLAVPTLRSVAFCGISTGVFGFPAEAAAGIALGAVADWLAAHPDALDLVVFNVFSDRDHALYSNALTTW